MLAEREKVESGAERAALGPAEVQVIFSKAEREGMVERLGWGRRRKCELAVSLGSGDGLHTELLGLDSNQGHSDLPRWASHGTVKVLVFLAP